MKPNTLLLRCLACLLAVSVVACSSTGSSVDLGKDTNAAKSAGVSASDLTSAGLIPPGGAKVDYDKSLIFGSGQNWIGRMVLQLNQASSEAYNYFLQQYPRQGWMLVSAVRGKNSLLVFTKADRSITVELSEAGFLEGGAKAVLTISPRSAQPEPSAAGAQGAPRRP